MRRLSLTTRASLFSFVPVCIVLLCFSIAVNTAVHNQIRRELRDQLRESDLVLNRVQSAYSHRVSLLISKVAERAGLKAAVGLLSEVRHDPTLLKEARDTIGMQLRDLQASSGFEFLAVTDLQGNVVTAVPCSECSRGASIPQLPLVPGIVPIEGRLYQVHSVPIATGEDQIAALVLGVPFELGSLSLPGDAALLHDGKIIASTLPARLTTSIERQIAARFRALPRIARYRWEARHLSSPKCKKARWAPDIACLVSNRWTGRRITLHPVS